MEKNEEHKLTLWLIHKDPILWIRLRKNVIACGKINPSCFQLLRRTWEGYEEIRRLVVDRIKEERPELIMEAFLLENNND